jgi:hypothetical protein
VSLQRACSLTFGYAALATANSLSSAERATPSLQTDSGGASGASGANTAPASQADGGAKRRRRREKSRDTDISNAPMALGDVTLLSEAAVSEIAAGGAESESTLPAKRRSAGERFKPSKQRTLFNDQALLQEEAPLSPLFQTLLSVHMRTVLSSLNYGIVIISRLLIGSDHRPPEICIVRMNGSKAVQLVVEPSGLFRVQTGYQPGLMKFDDSLTAPQFLNSIGLTDAVLPNDAQSIGLLVSRLDDRLSWCRGVPAPDASSKLPLCCRHGAVEVVL